MTFPEAPNRPLRGALLATTILAIVLLTTLSCGSGAGESAAGAGSTRTDDGGDVTVKATWDGSLRPAKFQIALDTHTIDLDAYELARLVVLRVDGGAELSPVSSNESKGGHHRQATLVFDPAQSARSFSRLELVVKGVGGKAERVLRWESKAE